MSKALTNLEQETTKVAKFKPTTKQIKWLETQIELGTDKKVKIAKLSGIARTTYYDWLKIPGFWDWYIMEYRKAREKWLPYLDKIGLKRAEKDYNYWRDMREAAGEVVQKGQANVQVNVNPILGGKTTNDVYRNNGGDETAEIKEKD